MTILMVVDPRFRGDDRAAGMTEKLGWFGYGPIKGGFSVFICGVFCFLSGKK